ADYHGVPYCVPAASGTAGLMLALEACGSTGPGRAPGAGARARTRTARPPPHLGGAGTPARAVRTRRP
ncbi:hypothetical protein, partial [Streptomyces fradiae]|uniref:hypothetical protein n=1 Tax=Streptomyces fradiae TaxID=1906 RepID=UPI0033E355DE